jgi:uncharacterized membrane protein
MRWIISTQIPVQLATIRFTLIVLLIVCLFTLLAALAEGTVIVLSLCNTRQKPVDRVLHELWLTRNRVAVITAGFLIISVIVKTVTGFIAVNGLQRRPLNVYFLLQVLILIQSVILIHCDFHSAVFFLISSAVEMSVTAILLCKVRQMASIRIMAGVLILDANAIGMQHC